MDYLARKLIEANPFNLRNPITRTVDKLDVFKTLEEKNKKKLAGIKRQMQATDEAMESARNKNAFIRKALK